MSPAPPSTCSSRSRRRRTRCSACPTSSARRISAPRPPRRRRTSRCRSPSRCRTTCCSGAISNAVNFPSITAEEAPKLKPFVALAEKLGSFAGQLTESGDRRRHASTYEGEVAELNDQGADRRRRSPACCGRCWPTSTWSPRRSIAKERGIVGRRGDARGRGRLRERSSRVTVDDRAAGRARSPARCSPTASRASSRSRASAWRPSSRRSCSTSPTRTSRASSAASARCWARPASTSRPSTSAATQPGGDAIALVEVDGEVPAEVLAKMQSLPQVKQAKALRF